MSDLFSRAEKVMPGGVNSPVRSFQAVEMDPVFVDSANGSKIYDTNGKEYIDYVCSYGPLILGHNHPEVAKNIKEAVDKGVSYGAPTVKEIKMAELITENVPGIDMVRMVNSGTEAVMSALRLARGFTKRTKIIKFVGCYHGHSDAMLVSAGSGLVTFSNPDSAGVTKGQAEDTLLAIYNDIESVEKLFEANKDNVAAVIIEPIAANMGVVLPKENFLKEVRDLCDKNNSLLIFDEVITGFRLAYGGAQEYLGVNADIVTYGKIVGGGLPVGAYGARREIMECVSPLGSVYQAGTLSGNPLAMSAGITQLTILKDNPDIYKNIEELAKKLADSLRNIAKELEVPMHVNQIGSLVCAFFTDEAVEDFATAKTSHTDYFAKYFKLMLERGINIAPAQFEAMFISNAHTVEDIETTVNTAREVLTIMKKESVFR